MKTILMIVFVNMMNPADEPKMVHASFPTEAACINAYEKAAAEAPFTSNIKVIPFCVKAADLVD